MYKYPYDKEAVNHLSKMSGRVCRYGEMEEYPYFWRGDRLECDILKCKSLADMYYSGDKKTRDSIVNKYSEILMACSNKGCYYSKEFEKVFGLNKPLEELNWLDNGNVDLSFDNIYVKDGKWLIIDSEWNLGIPVPVESIMY